MADFYENDAGGDEFGTAVEAIHQFPESLDYEWLIMSLEIDHAKIVLIRHFGLRGKAAARAAGFSSEWSLYRRDHEFKKNLQRQRAHFIG